MPLVQRPSLSFIHVAAPSFSIFTGQCWATFSRSSITLQTLDSSRRELHHLFWFSILDIKSTLMACWALYTFIPVRSKEFLLKWMFRCCQVIVRLVSATHMWFLCCGLCFPPKHLHIQLLLHPLSTFTHFHPNPSKASGTWALTG